MSNGRPRGLRDAIFDGEEKKSDANLRAKREIFFFMNLLVTFVMMLIYERSEQFFFAFETKIIYWMMPKILISLFIY